MKSEEQEERERLTERDEIANVREAFHDGLNGGEVKVIVADNDDHVS